MSDIIKTTLSMDEIEALFDKEIVDSTLSGVKVDKYDVVTGRVLIYEKCFYGARDFLSVTFILNESPEFTTIDWNIKGPEIDLWNTIGRFEKMITKILSNYTSDI